MTPEGRLGFSAFCATFCYGRRQKIILVAWRVLPVLIWCRTISTRVTISVTGCSTDSGVHLHKVELCQIQQKFNCAGAAYRASRAKPRFTHLPAQLASGSLRAPLPSATVTTLNGSFSLAVINHRVHPQGLESQCDVVDRRGVRCKRYRL